MARVPFPEETARLVLNRAAGRCERCGLRVAIPALHHRKPRGMGSSTADPHAVDNVVALDDNCHRWVHAHPLRAVLDGWTVPRWGDPAGVPIVGWMGPVLLTEAGSYETAPP